MRAIYLEEPGKIFIKDIEYAEDIPKNYAKIKVKAVGICGSDIYAYKGLSPLITYPRILGHEVVGEIIEINSTDPNFQVGDRVILKPYLYCGYCYACKRGRTNCCENLQVIGVHIDGGMREYLHHPVDLLYKLPINLSYEEAVMIEPLSIALHAVNRLQLKSGEYVVILGAGQIGLLSAQIALHLNAVPILIDLLDSRLDLAKSMGVKFVLNPNKDDLLKEIKNLTNGRMADCVIEASGSITAIKSAIDFVAHAGRIVLIGWSSKEVPLWTDLIIKKELDIYGSRNSVGEFSEAIDFISHGIVKVKPLISKVICFEEIPNYVKIISKNPGDYVKIIGKL